MKVSRRQLVQAFAATAVTAPLAEEAAAQTAPDAELEGARQYLRTSAQIVRQVQLPMATEPATRFVPRS